MTDTGIRWTGVPLPDFIRELPEIEVSLEGVRGWLVQGASRQVVYFELQSGTVIPRHSHAAQWGMVIDGVLSLTIGEETRDLRKGDSYVIPAGVAHSAVCPTKVIAVDLFASAGRYRPKKTES